MNETAQNPTLSAKQTRAIAALLEAPSTAAAMKQAGVARTTLYLWLKNESFRTELARARRAAYDEALHGLKSLSTAAVAELQRLLRSRDERVRLSAVKLALDGGFTAHERIDVEQRLAQLEEYAASRKGGSY